MLELYQGFILYDITDDIPFDITYDPTFVLLLS